MSEAFWFNIILSLLILNFLFSSILEYINDKSWKDKIPDSLKDFYSKKNYKKAKNYKIENSRISLLSSTISFLLTLSIFLSGFYGYLSDYLISQSNSAFIQSSMFFLFFFFLNTLISIPIKYYSTFIIEEKYGFNISSI